jgi:beta-sarcoglycan
MGQQGIDFIGVNSMLINDRETNTPIFSSSKLKYNIDKPIRNLKSTTVNAAEIVSPVDKKLQVEGVNIFVRGIEGTRIDGKEVFTSAEQNIFLKSSNGSIAIDASKGIFIDIDRLPINPDGLFSSIHDDLQYKLCICYPKGVIYRVPLPTVRVKDVCRNFDRRRFNPCV